MNGKIPNLNDWGPLKNLSEEKQKVIIKKIKFISLKMGHKITDFDEMPDVIKYNEVDCKALADILQWVKKWIN